MPAPAPVLSFGALEEQLGGLRWRRKRRDFDSCFYSVDSLDENFIVPGSPLPGYPHMKAVDVAPEQVGDVWNFIGTEYKGFKDPAETWRLFGKVKNSPSEGFDNLTVTIGTKEPGHARFARGANCPTSGDTPTTMPYMWIVDRTDEETDICNEAGEALYEVLNLNLRGLLGYKPYVRRVTTSNNTLAPSDNFIMYDSMNALGEIISGNSSYGSQPHELSLAKILVTDSFVTTSTPPFGGIPGNVTPVDAPAWTTLSFSGVTNYRYYWPHGWRRANIQAEKIPGQSCWAWSVTYENQQQVLPS